MMASLQMVDGAREFAERLKSIKGSPEYSVTYVVLSGETHNTGIPASTSRGIAFVVSH
jgi:hypothetical protein